MSLDALGISSRAGRINDERCFVVLAAAGKAEGSPSGIRKLLGGKQNDFDALASRAFSSILSITEDETALRVSAKPLSSNFQASAGARGTTTPPIRKMPSSAKTQCGTFSMRMPTRSPRRTPRASRPAAMRSVSRSNVGVGEFLEAIGVVENERGAAQVPVSPTPRYDRRSNVR